MKDEVMLVAVLSDVLKAIDRFEDNCFSSESRINLHEAASRAASVLVDYRMRLELEKKRRA